RGSPHRAARCRATLPRLPHRHVERLRRPSGDTTRGGGAHRARDCGGLQGCRLRRAPGEDRRRPGVRHAGAVHTGDPRGSADLEGSGTGGGNEAAMTLRLAIPDLISPSYFPAIAAVELGFLDAKLELL